MMRTEDENCIQIMIIEAEVAGRRSLGRQKKGWEDMIGLQQSLKSFRLKKEDHDNRNKWRKVSMLLT